MVAFPKTEEPSYTVKLTLFSELDTSVEIEWASGTVENISLTANTAKVHEIAGNMRSVDQLENKGFYISSSHNITALVADFYKGGDTFKLFPIQQGASEDLYSYIVASHNPEVNPSYLSSFVLLTTNFTNTFINIYRRENGVLEEYTNFTLQRLQTMNLRFDNLDPTGTVIMANNPITVISGMENNRLNSASGPDSLYMAIPPKEFLSTAHIVPPINGRYADAGYLIRVISAADENLLTFFNNSADSWTAPVTKHEGEFTEFDQALTDEAVAVKCTNRCLVVQYNKGQEGGGASDPFMMWIPSLHLYAKENITLYTSRNGEDKDFNNHISIIALHPTLNGTENIDIADSGLAGTSWVPVEPWSQYKYKAKDVAEGSHHVGALSDCQGYLVWMYGHKSYRGYGYLGTVGDLISQGMYGIMIQKIVNIVACHLQGAPCYGGVRTCGGLKNGLLTLQ